MAILQGYPGDSESDAAITQPMGNSHRRNVFQSLRCILLQTSLSWKSCSGSLL